MFVFQQGRGCEPTHWGMRHGGWGTHGRHGPGREGMGRGRRVFDSGELRLVLLRLIAEQPRHGYDLIRAIESMTAGAYAPSPGVVYPTLTLLDDMGMIEARESDGAKKLFAITPTGEAELTANQELVDALLARLAELGAHRERTEAAPVRRAMANLRTVLQDRLGETEVDRATLHRIAALIDDAAQQIERLA